MDIQENPIRLHHSLDSIVFRTLTNGINTCLKKALYKKMRLPLKNGNRMNAPSFFLEIEQFIHIPD
jgi:hypothetical protein